MATMCFAPGFFWHEAEGVCALSDAERHLGHALRTPQGDWEAFDGTHPDDTRTGFRPIGRFADLNEARRAIEYATLQPANPRLM